MATYSMSTSLDGFISDRDGGFDWSGPDDEQFRFHLEQVSEVGIHLLGRRLYEDMRVRPFRYPVVVGGGTPFLPPVADTVHLELIETRTFNARVVFERHRLVR